MITVIHGPTGTGKTKHKHAFAAHYNCTHVVDSWDATEHEFPLEDGRLILTTSSPHAIEDAFHIDGTRHLCRVIDVQSARLAIGVPAFAPAVSERLAR